MLFYVGLYQTGMCIDVIVDSLVGECPLTQLLITLLDSLTELRVL